ncbi:GntR family transcriptional regulator [Paenibacillus zeisoli]|uniref:GntR family transcriptional regulator n=1 Tax=Paenibacillus zeisoli TaxID=2496267 RepID=A0A3S1B7G7_9BACL|nr:GntR family transcriptional regulator [Paenibacillus zeisoli]RUT33809.1 GntR family transcriptional regulator [Paenibacillus zeisoli]
MHYPSSWLQGASLGESIACELRLQIIKGTVKAGEILSENRIAADFGTSRSPVREAMRTLSGEGLIRLERMGAVVLGLSLKNVEELYDVRYLIESFVQQRLPLKKLTGLIPSLKQTIDKMELAAKHRDVVDFSFQDLSFHEAMILEADHTRILHLWKSIRHIVMTVMLVTTEEVFSEGEDKVQFVVNKHRILIEGLESKNPERIEEVVREYFSDSHSTLHHSFPR